MRQVDTLIDGSSESPLSNRCKINFSHGSIITSDRSYKIKENFFFSVYYFILWINLMYRNIWILWISTNIFTLTTRSMYSFNTELKNYG